MSNESKNEGNITNTSNNNNKIAELAEQYGWKYVKQLHENGFTFFGENNLKSCKNMFVSGFVTCASLLKDRFRIELTEAKRYESSDDPWGLSNSVSILTEKEIEEIINKVFC